MSSIDPKLVARAARKLIAGVNARNFEAADRRLHRIGRWAMRSDVNMSAAFGATQLLRDMDVIDWAESAYLFREFFEHVLDSELGNVEPDPDLARAISEKTPMELILAAMGHNDASRAAALHRSHGEAELAAMILNDPDGYSTLCTEGAMSLLEDLPRLDDPKPGAQNSNALALTERVIALAATETMREWHPAWIAVCDALRNADPASAVAAIQGARDIGMISFDESLVLIDLAIEPLVNAAAACDRKCRRLELAIEVTDRPNEPASPDLAMAVWDNVPYAVRILRDRLIRRIDGITAQTLRQFNEHRMANLLIRQPDEYARLRDEIDVGGRAHDAKPSDDAEASDAPD